MNRNPGRPGPTDVSRAVLMRMADKGGFEMNLIIAIDKIPFGVITTKIKWGNLNMLGVERNQHTGL